MNEIVLVIWTLLGDHYVMSVQAVPRAMCEEIAARLAHDPTLEAVTCARAEHRAAAIKAGRCESNGTQYICERVAAWTPSSG